MEQVHSFLLAVAFLASIFFFSSLLWGALDWVWFKPRRLERVLKQQGLKGNPYRVLSGDMKDLATMIRDATSKPMNLSDHYTPTRLIPFYLHLINKYGRNCYVWMGPRPMVLITDPGLIKEVLNKPYLFQKPRTNPLVGKLVQGLASYEKDQWEKHRSRFWTLCMLYVQRHVYGRLLWESAMLMQPAFLLSCGEMVKKWEEIVSQKQSCELDVWPDLEGLTSDVISRTAFGSSYEEGRMIFELQKEQAMHVMEVLRQVYVPGWRFLPTKRNKRMNAIEKEVKSLIRDIIGKRMKERSAKY
ncbi:unnamed protein product [Cuscuta campestris]|uniref:Cytochrome P450 n=1 Tax=Cuscuta campestris TaxID=132261 RepID=A0A484NM19_9ASTE|nr:unnamed protein product [Cuscuta campestris]